MGRYIGPVEKLSRREGVNLHLKGERSYTKSPVDKPTGTMAPGQRGKRRAKITEYGKRLREKQKTKRMAGLLEKQFFRYFEKARHMSGKTGENLLLLLENRLDNIVKRLGIGASIRAARQIVNHGHIKVNGQRVDIPSYQVKVGDVISLTDRKKGNILIQKSISNQISRQIPSWLALNQQVIDTLGKSKDFPVDLSSIKVEGTVKAIPTREEMSFPVNEQYIVELYSK